MKGAEKRAGREIFLSRTKVFASRWTTLGVKGGDDAA